MDMWLQHFGLSHPKTDLKFILQQNLITELICFIFTH